MNDALDWREDDDAPSPGAVVGPLSKFAEDGAYFEEMGDFSLLLLRRGADLRAYWNVCPHQFLPLNWRGPGVLGEGAATIRCSNHDAAFDAATGAPRPGGVHVDCGLSPVPLRIAGDRVLIGEGAP